jgi:hypothetical protein
MGAEFIGTFIKMPSVSKEDAFDALSKMSDKQLDELFIQVNGYEPDPEDDPSRVFFKEVLALFYNETVVRRDVGEWLIDGQAYLVTGGMTWGDDPTDSYAVIEAVAALNITNTPEDSR